MTISKNCSGLPVSGVVKSQMEVTFLSDSFSASAAAPVKIYIDNAKKYQTCYIYTRKIRNGQISLSCIDRMMFLSQVFDTTELTPDADGNVIVSHVVLQIAKQCSFAKTVNVPSILEKIPLDDINGAECEEILSELSQVFCGVWYSDTSGEEEYLGFNRFGEATEMVPLDSGNNSELTVGAVKGPIGRIVATAGSEVFDTGGTADFNQILKLSSKYFTSVITNQLLSELTNAIYTAFEIDKTDVVADAHICSAVSIGDRQFIATKISISIAAEGIITGYSAADLCEAEWDYTGALNRKLKNKVDYNVPSAGTSITRNEGIKIEGDYAVITAADGKMTIYKKEDSSG